MDRSITLEATERADGKVRFASADLPGFRLLLDQKSDRSEYDKDVIDALRFFMPYFARAQQSRAIDVRPVEEAPGARRGKAFKMVANFASC